LKKINERLKKLFNRKLIANQNKNIVNRNIDITDNENKKYFTIPYIRNISEIIASLINKSFTVGYKCLNQIDNIVKAHKNQTEHNYKSNIVYKIYCQNCDALYVGQTKRQLKTRIKHFNKLDESRITRLLHNIS